MPLVRFGVFELDPERGELRRQGRRVHLAGGRAHSRATTRADARAAFERGLAATAQGPGGARRGIYAFREAARLDPRFAEAHYALADTYLDLASQRELPLEPALAEARA